MSGTRNNQKRPESCPPERGRTYTKPVTFIKIPPSNAISVPSSDSINVPAHTPRHKSMSPPIKGEQPISVSAPLSSSLSEIKHSSSDPILTPKLNNLSSSSSSSSSSVLISLASKSSNVVTLNVGTIDLLRKQFLDEAIKAYEEEGVSVVPADLMIEDQYKVRGKLVIPTIEQMNEAHQERFLAKKLIIKEDLETVIEHYLHEIPDLGGCLTKDPNKTTALFYTHNLPNAMEDFKNQSNGHKYLNDGQHFVRIRKNSSPKKTALSRGTVYKFVCPTTTPEKLDEEIEELKELFALCKRQGVDEIRLIVGRNDDLSLQPNEREDAGQQAFNQLKQRIIDECIAGDARLTKIINPSHQHKKTLPEYLLTSREEWEKEPAYLESLQVFVLLAKNDRYRNIFVRDVMAYLNLFYPKQIEKYQETPVVAESPSPESVLSGILHALSLSHVKLVEKSTADEDALRDLAKSQSNLTSSLSFLLMLTPNNTQKNVTYASAPMVFMPAPGKQPSNGLAIANSKKHHNVRARA